MISWEDDDLGVWRELEALRTVFEERYHFQVEEYRIPSIGQPDRALKRRAIEFLDHSDGEETLLIMYYAGHARRAPEENAGPLWCANRSNSQPAISSGGTQSLFEEADADVLLIYDCCHSAGVPTVGSTVPTTGQKTKGHAVEIIAACGYETVAPEVDQHSFTKALTEILALSSKGEPFSVGILHSRVLGKLKCWAPSLQIDKKGKFVEDTEGRLLYERQPRRTPIYSIVCETEPRRSILLSSMSSRDSSLSSISSCGQNTPSPSSDPDSALSNDPMTAANSNPRKGKRSLNENGLCPQILLAIRLEQDDLDIAQWTDWIRNVPAVGTEVRIEGIYESFSTLLLLRMPVSVWNLLPSNPAYTFIGFVTSENMSHQLGLPPSSSSIPSENRCASCTKTHVTVNDPKVLPGLETADKDRPAEDDTTQEVVDDPKPGIPTAEVTLRHSQISLSKASEDLRPRSSSSSNTANPSPAHHVPTADQAEVNISPAPVSLPHAAAKRASIFGGLLKSFKRGDSNKTATPGSPAQVTATNIPNSVLSSSSASASVHRFQSNIFTPPDIDIQNLTLRNRQESTDVELNSSANSSGFEDAWARHSRPTEAGNVDQIAARIATQFEPSTSMEDKSTPNTQGSMSSVKDPVVFQGSGQSGASPGSSRRQKYESQSTGHRSHSHGKSHSSSSMRKESKKERPWHWEQIWFCCQCNSNGARPISIWSEMCICSHLRDSYCTVENIKIYDDR